MSIEITYRKAVVKLQDGRTIPILETWSNNCWELPTREHPKGRRERWRGILTWLCGTKESIEKYIKTRVQRYIDDNENEEYKKWNNENRKEMDSQRWASWRFPWRINLWQVINYVSNPNIDLDIADEHITIYREWDTGHRVKPSDIDKLHPENWWRLYVSGIEQALREQKNRNRINKQNNPSTPKPKGNRAIKLSDYYGFIQRLTKRRLSHTSYESGAKRFQTKNQAIKRAEKMRIADRFINTYEVILLNNQTT